MFFSSNQFASECVLKFFENYQPEKEAKALIWLMKSGEYLAYDNDFQFLKFKEVLSFYTKTSSGKSFSISSLDNLNISTTPAFKEVMTEKINGIWSYTTLFKVEENIKVARKIKITDDDENKVIRFLQSNAIVDDVGNILNSKRQNGSFPLYNLITKHLEIDESIQGLTYYSGRITPESCDAPIWQTAFVIIYLKYVLGGYKDKWESDDAYKEASQWVSNNLRISQLEENELYDACKQYLLERGIVNFNKSAKTSVFRYDINENARDLICNKLKQLVKENDIEDLLRSKSDHGYFTCKKITSGKFQIDLKTDTIDTLKNYVDALGLRRYDDNVWRTAFVIVYLEMILKDLLPNWSSVRGEAMKLINNKVFNRELEEKLFDACRQFLMKRGCEFYTENIEL